MHLRASKQTKVQGMMIYLSMLSKKCLMKYLLFWNIFNISLANGVFPGKLKIARVTAIFKKRKQPLITNLVLSLFVHSWPPLPGTAFPDLVRHRTRGDGECWVSLNNSNIFLWLLCWIFRKFLRNTFGRADHSKKIVTLHIVTFLTVNSISNIFLQLLKIFQKTISKKARILDTN